MPSGLLIRNQNSVFEVTEHTRLVRFLGVPLNSGTSPGSLNVPEWAQGQPVFFPFFTRTAHEHFTPPIFSISGTTLSWTFRQGKTPTPVQFIVGVSA